MTYPTTEKMRLTAMALALALTEKSDIVKQLVTLLRKLNSMILSHVYLKNDVVVASTDVTAQQSTNVI